MNSSTLRLNLLFTSLIAILAMWMMILLPSSASAQVTNPQSGSTGVQGKISSPAPTTGATISIPRDGQGIAANPTTVSGLCSGDLLIKVFKNNVFAGSVQCKNGSFSILIDLFDGRNELVARVYDSLDQAGPDSNVVGVNFNQNLIGQVSRVSLTSNFAKRGANPGAVLTWPIIMSGGVGPYAVSIDWGDGKTPDLKSQAFPGTFDVQHTYDSPGVYNIIVKATDKNGGVAYLQLVGIANGALQDNNTSGGDSDAAVSTTTKTRILWQPVAVLVPFLLATFWLGKKYELHVLRKKIERGDRPF